MAIEFASLLISFKGVLSALGDNTGSGGNANVTVDHRWSNGTTANLGNTLFHDTRTVGASSNEDLDLTALTDGNGVALSNADITCIIFSAASGNGDEFQITPAAANGWTALISGTAPVLRLKAGMTIAVYAPTDPGLAVSGSSLGINFANQDTGAGGSYTITILGRNA